MGRRGEGSWDTIKRGARRYARFRITIDGRTIERTGPSRAALEKTAADLRRRARQRLVGADEEITLRDWAIERWLPAKELELGHAGQKTLRNYRSVLERHVVPLLGALKVRDLRAEHRRRLQRALLAEGLKASTVNVVDGVLKACLQAAAHDELPVVVSAITAVKPVKSAPAEKRTLALADVRAILARESEWSALWCCFAHTGARDAEVRALRWSDWDQTVGVLRVRRQLPQQPGDPPQFQQWIKGRKAERVVPVTPVLAQALREHKAHQNARRLALPPKHWVANDLIFPDEIGRALPAHRVNRQFEAACRRAGIAVWTGLGVHKLRGAANEILREAGVDTPTRAAILGHTAAVNEGYYTADNARLMAEAMGKLGAALG